MTCSTSSNVRSSPLATTSTLKVCVVVKCGQELLQNLMTEYVLILQREPKQNELSINNGDVFYNWLHSSNLWLLKCTLNRLIRIVLGGNTTCPPKISYVQFELNQSALQKWSNCCSSCLPLYKMFPKSPLSDINSRHSSYLPQHNVFRTAPGLWQQKCCKRVFCIS